MMRRILAIAGTLLLAVQSVFSAKNGQDRPNIIFLLADDMGFMDVAFNNPKSFYRTPNLDALARSGMRFTQGYAACCVCSPTRGSIMTGKYPPRFGITDYIGQNRPGKLTPAPNARFLPLEEITIAETFRKAGYATFFSGKWHLGNGDYSPNAQGFGPGLTGKGSFYYPTEKSSRDPKDDPKTTERIVDDAVKFISEHKNQPFFAYVPFLAVHIPIGARDDLIKKYEAAKSSAPPEAWGKERQSKVRLVQNHAAYAAMVEQLDSGIGRLLGALESNGLADKTIVVFTSDNGGLATAEGHPTSNFPLRGGKGWPYEGGIRTPWVIRAPGVTKRSTVCETPVVTTDFYPTLLDLAGLPLAPEQHRDGVSLVPLLKNKKLKRGAPLFWHYPHYGNQGGAPCGTIRDGDWKMIEWFEDGSRELYNIKNDPGETKDLAAENPKKIKELQERLIRWRKEVGAIMPTRANQ